MRSKREIENQLEHFRSGACGTAGTPENAVWIEALEWVLDLKHQAEYDHFIHKIAELAEPFGDYASVHERSMALGFKLLLNRLK